MPVFTSEPVPAITPEKALLVLAPPVVNAAEPRVTAPAPASDPIVCAWLASANVAPLATVTAVVDGSALATPACSVPAATLVAPV